MGYEPKFVNDAFAFKETVTEMRQHLERTKTEAEKPPKPVLTKDHHQEALVTAKTPMFTSKSSDIQVVLPSGRSLSTL